MKFVVCPHCKAHRIAAAKMPKDVVVVIPCPACHELVVMFRNKVGALSRKILEHGTHEQRTTHLAEVIAEFLEPGMSPLDLHESSDGDGAPEHAHEDHVSGGAEEGFDDAPGPITDREMRRFLQVDLKLIDNPTYFKRHFS